MSPCHLPISPSSPRPSPGHFPSWVPRVLGAYKGLFHPAATPRCPLPLGGFTQYLFAYTSRVKQGLSILFVFTSTERSTMIRRVYSVASGIFPLLGETDGGKVCKRWGFPNSFWGFRISRCSYIPHLFSYLFSRSGLSPSTIKRQNYENCNGHQKSLRLVLVFYPKHNL